MKNLKYLLIVFSVILFSCGSSNDQGYATSSKKAGYYEEETMSEDAYEELATKPEESSPEGTESEPIKVTERKIIKTGSISFETDELKKTREHINKAVKEFDAYISSDSENKYTSKVEQTVTIRVPFAKFDDLLAKIVSGADHLDSRNINARDVTEEYVDVKTRIKTKKELEARYLEILKKANSVSDIMEVERQIGVLREEIESAEGRLRYLENQASLSTLTVTFYEYHESEKGFGSEFTRGFVNGWNNMVWFFIGLVNIWPFLIFIGVIVWLIIRAYRKRKAKTEVK